MKPYRILLILLTIPLLTVGCGRADIMEEESSPSATRTVSGDFGDLKNVCHSGSPQPSSAQGVTSQEIELGVFTDMGFTKNAELVNAARVFTAWCNDAGGVGGRRLVANIRDAKLTEVRPRMLDACAEDFALVGGSAALDGLGVKARLSCLLPDFPAQADQIANIGSDLQVGAGTPSTPAFDANSAFHSWLFQTYPGSAAAVGLINGDSPITKIAGDALNESLTASGATIVYNNLYPAMGVSDWTPYAQSIKAKGVKGLIFLGDYRQLAKLEDVLTGLDYKLDWIDSNSNSYTPTFIELLGRSATYQNNYANLSGVASMASSDKIPAVKQVEDLFAAYAPGEEVTYPALKAFSAWLLFAKSAATCVDTLTRKCVFETASQETAWTGGGLTAPVDMSASGSVAKCFNIERATGQGWQTAPFEPDSGVFRCDSEPYRFRNDYGKPMRLSDIGKSYDEFD